MICLYNIYSRFSKKKSTKKLPHTNMLKLWKQGRIQGSVWLSWQAPLYCKYSALNQ